jgi:O-antigen/teichoic acid export membrane protein
MSDEAPSDRAEDASGTNGVENDSNLSKLMSSATLVIVGEILYSVSTLAERVLIANVLSPEAYGQVGIGLSVLTIGATLGVFGSSAGVARYLSRFTDETDQRGVALTGLMIAVLGSITITAALYLNVDLLGSYLLDEGDSTRLLGLFVLTIPVVSLVAIGVGLIRGMENTIYRMYARQIVYPGLRLLLLIVFLVGFGWGVAAAGYAYIVSAAVTVVVAFLLFGRLFAIRGPFRTNVRELLSYSAPLVFAELSGTLLTRSDTLMIGFFRTNAEVGYYAAAYPLAGGLSLFLGAFGFMYLPIVSRLDSEDRLDEVNDTYKLTTKWVYLLTFPVFLLFFTFPDDVLRIVFQPEYEIAGLALSILCVGKLSAVATGQCTETLSALGETKAIFLINGSALALNFGMNLVFIPRYGFVGAAVASAVASGALNGVTVLALRQWFGITPFSSASVRTFVVLPVVLIPPFLLLARGISLSVLTMAILIITMPVLSLVVYFAGGCAEAEDRIAATLIEDKLGRSLPLVDRVLPPRE